MNLPISFQRMISLGLMILLSGIVPAAHAAEEEASVAIVIMAVGHVSATDTSGVVRSLQRRSDIHNTDTITTDSASRTQIRFTDGELLSLQENSQFKIEDYHYKAATADNAAYSLLKGSMRTISGAIGKKNRDAYKVQTPVATIGIRGTDYELVLHNNSKSGDTELYGYIDDGVINVANSAGNEDFGHNEFFVVGGPGQSPRQLLNPPEFMFKGYVPPQPKAGLDTAAAIFQGNSTGLSSLFNEATNSLPDISNPSYTPFSTVSNLTGQYDYVFDTALTGGQLPSVQNDGTVTAVSVYSLVGVDFNSQMITYGSVSVTLSDNTIMDGYLQNTYTLSDVIAKQQSMMLSGNHWSATYISLAPTTGTLALQFLGADAQGAVGNYNISEIPGAKPSVSVSGSAIYSQQPAGQ